MTNREKYEKDLIHKIQNLSDKELAEIIIWFENDIMYSTDDYHKTLRKLQITDCGPYAKHSYCSVCKKETPSTHQKCEEDDNLDDDSFFKNRECEKGRAKWLKQEYKPSKYWLYNE